MNAVSWLYSRARRDGTVIATFNKSQPFYQELGEAGACFKTQELNWIGSLSHASAKPESEISTLRPVDDELAAVTLQSNPRCFVILGGPSTALFYIAPSLGLKNSKNRPISSFCFLPNNRLGCPFGRPQLWIANSILA
jgi:hypothetical protein